MEEKPTTIGRIFGHPVFTALIAGILGAAGVVVAAFVERDAVLKSVELTLSATKSEGKGARSVQTTLNAQELESGRASPTGKDSQGDNEKFANATSINEQEKQGAQGGGSGNTSEKASPDLAVEERHDVESLKITRSDTSRASPTGKYSQGDNEKLANATPINEQEKQGTQGDGSGNTSEKASPDLAVEERHDVESLKITRSDTSDVTQVVKKFVTPSKWEGSVSWKEGKYWWIFESDGTFTESEGYGGVWRTDKDEIEIMYPGGTVYRGYISPQRIVGVRYNKRGLADGTFSLANSSHE